MQQLFRTLREHRDRAGRILSGAALLLLAAGTASPALGLLFTVLNAAAPGVHFFAYAGTVLMIATIPLLLGASHLLDVIERRERMRAQVSETERI